MNLTWKMVQEFLESAYCWVEDGSGNRLPNAVINGDLSAFLATLPEDVAEPHPEALKELRHWLQECLDVVNRGVEIVTDEQLGTWNNVRTVVEVVPEILDGSRAISGSCDWREDEDGTWFTECANAFQFYTGGPSENGAKYCIYCGKPVNEQKRGNEKHKKDKQ